MKKIIPLLLITFIISAINAQINKYGYPLYKFYNPEEIGSNAQNWDIVKSNNGLVYVANNFNGVLEYDGEEWRSIKIEGEPDVRSIAINKDGILFLGCSGDFGCLLPNKSGALVFKSLSESIPDSTKSFNIWNVYCNNDSVYFSSNDFRLFKYILPEDSLQTIQLPKHTFKTFLHKNKILGGTYDKGLYSVKNDSCMFVEYSDFYAYKNIFEIFHDSLNDYVVTGKMGIYNQNFDSGESVNILPDRTINFIKDVYTYSAFTNDDHFVLGTIGKGMVITDKQGELDAVLDKEIGIKDHYCIGVSEVDQTYWGSFSIGASCIEYKNPFRKFGEESGLEGFINVIKKFENTIYIGTDVGLFYLKYDNNGGAYFEKIKDIDDQIFSLGTIIDKATNKKSLVAGGVLQGLFRINTKLKKGFLINNKLEGITVLYPQMTKGEIEKIELNVFNLFNSNEGKLWVGVPKYFFSVELNNGKWTITDEVFFTEEQSFNSLVDDGQGNIWGGTDINGIFKMGVFDNKLEKFHSSEGLPVKCNLRIFKNNQSLVVLSEKGIFRFNGKSNTFVKDKELNEIINSNGLVASRIHELSDNTLLINSKHDNQFQLDRISSIDNKFGFINNYFSRIKNFEIEYIFEDTIENILWISSANNLYTYNLNSNFKPLQEYNTLVRKVVGPDTIYFEGSFYGEYSDKLNSYLPSEVQRENQKPIIEYQSNDLIFHFAAPYFEADDEILYSYKLEGFKNEWSKWNNEPKAVYTNINEGQYTFKVKAKNIYGYESSIGEYGFTILPPWYRTIFAYFLYVVFSLFAIIIIIKLYTRRLQQEKIRLEEIVRERTAEIREQRDQIAEQKQSIEDSILYASRIQRAILPSHELANEILPEHFILFRPRDIVSGDYYWMNKIEDKVIIVAADCTGHGVPGAFMSMLGVSFLNEIVLKEKIIEPHKILNKLRQRVKKTLKQEGKEGEAKDGMDVALVVIDETNRKLYFSGAYNPVYIYRNNELIEIKADKMPIGIYIREKDSFTLNEFDYQTGDTFYIFSDGYADQFGGEKGQKFKTKAMKQLMLDIQSKAMCDQKEILNTNIEEWMGKEEQIDDMVILGVRLD